MVSSMMTTGTEAEAVAEAVVDGLGVEFPEEELEEELDEVPEDELGVAGGVFGILHVFL
jgi:hypothetical protein